VDALLEQAQQLQRAGQPEEAASICRTLLAADPNDVSARLQLARSEAAGGQLHAAVEHLDRLLALQPAHAQALHELALVLWSLGQTPEALAQIRQACGLEPQATEIWNNLGGLLEQLGRLDEAIDAYRRAVDLSPSLAIPHFNLGDALRKATRLEEATSELRLAATLDPDLQEAWAALGACLLARGQAASAAGPLRRAVVLRPEDAMACRHYGDALLVLGQRDQALPLYEQAARLDAQSVEAWYGRGRVLAAAGRIVEAIEAFRRGTTIDPHHVPSLHEQGKALFDLGCVEQAIPLLRQAAETAAEEDRTTALLNLAVITPGSPDEDNRSILRARRAWGQLFPSTPPRSWASPRTAGPMRVGYCSSFFAGANWMKPVWALINHHDREQFQLFLFSDGPADQIRFGYQPHPSDRFLDVSSLSNDEAAACIAAQELDLLVDLNGYSAPERLPLYTLRPAPILVGWFNMYATSGLDCYDYLIGDPHVIPEREEPYYTERILRLPHSYLTFEVYHPTPDVAPPPILTTGQLTLGCLASQYKITDQVISTWAEILQRSPGARMLIRNSRLDRPEHQRHLCDRCAACGIPRERLLLEGGAEHLAFLGTYNRVDIALDPFPYSGGTTTMEALWQGVPVVTFDGDRWASRTSVSLLRAAGLDEYIGRDRQDYAEICVRLASSPATAAKLQAFRAGIRERLRASPVCDAAALAQGMEELYRQIRAERAR
jgi:protein O-GlcNAc transferase